MTRVYEHKVMAVVRTDGATGSFERRPFYLMLAPGTPESKAKEATRILHQIGWETRGLTVHEPYESV